jgi:hypothetical protein
VLLLVPPIAQSLTSGVPILQPGNQPKRHILVCAPSNAAVDEIVMRLVTQGIWDQKGELRKPSIVRLVLFTVLTTTLILSSRANLNQCTLQYDRCHLTLFYKSTSRIHQANSRKRIKYCKKIGRVSNSTRLQELTQQQKLETAKCNFLD